MSGSKEIKHLEKAKLKAQKSRNLKEEASLCNQLGEALAKTGQFQEAIAEHRQELQLSEVLNDVIGCAVANRKIGECFAEIGNYKAALKHQRKHLELARSVTNDIEEQRAWATIGRTYLFIHETDQSWEWLKKAEDSFRKSLTIVDGKLEGKVSRHELSEMRARLYLNLGFLYDSTKDPVKCNHYIRKSVFIAEQNNLYEDLYRANFNLGSIHCRNSEPSKAVRCLEAAKECARKMKETFMESECFSSIGQVFLNLGDFVAAKRSLKKAFTLGSQQQSEHNTVRKNLKSAVKGCRLEEALSELPEKEQQEALGLCEQLGDLCCKVGTYQKAIDYYRTQLKHAEALRKADRELAVIHVSLAATFADLKDYEQSVKHYEAELGLRKGNPKEECETWLNMALAKEEGGKPHAELEECYRNALRCTERAQLPRLQLRAMKLLHWAQQKSGLPEASATQARLRELARAQGGESGDESETDEMENSEPLEDSELELSESDDDDMEGYDKSVPGRRKINQWNRRNEKGETVLHRACIEGNLKHVQCLVEKGHPLNPRDYCGWTPLHEACNHGHLEIVRLLLDLQVNVNDPGGPHCEGITPLHDAVTCGNFDVAELLIHKGASVTVRNARGLTPLDSLHEWSQNYYKHLDQDTKQQCKQIEELLRNGLARGAQPVQEFRDSDLFDSESSQSLHPSASHSTASKSRPLEPDSRRYQKDTGGLGRNRPNSSTAPLTQRRTTHDHDLSQSGAEEVAADDGLPLASSTQMSSRNQPDWPAVDEEESSEEDDVMLRFRPMRKRHRVVGQRSPVGPGVTEGEGGQPAASVDDESLSQGEPSDWDCTGTEQEERGSNAPGVGASAYLQAMRSLGSAKSRLLSQTLAEPCLTPQPSARRSALIPDCEYVGEDWLEDDLADGRPKKRPRGHCWVSSATGPEDTGHSSDDEASADPGLLPLAPASSGRPALQRKRSKQMRMTQIVDRAVVGRTKNSAGNGRSSSGTSVPRAPEVVHAFNVPAVPSNSSSPASQFVQPVNPAVPPSIRVRVRVQDNIFLIPIPHSDSEVRTVSWLAEQATQRYYQMCGLRPKLTLKKEGAMLAPQDPIVHVLQSNEEVLAEVLSWDLPPLTDRYKRACESLALAENGLVLRVCETQETNACFRLSNLSLNKDQLTPILRALKLQTATRELRLSANRLGDAAMDELPASLATMPNLTLLDLSSNQITHEGLKKLCDPTRLSGEPPFQSLEELNLSLNPLGDSSSQFIASLIKSCPVLSTLKLQACGLTAKFLQHFALNCRMKGSRHLKTLILSHNALGLRGVQLLLKTLPHDVLSRLEISSVLGNQDDKPFVELVVKYLSQAGCTLTHLNLSKNSLTDDSIGDFARRLPSFPSLASLDLSGNTGIGPVGLETLLAAFGERDSWMDVLDLSGCSISQHDMKSEAANWNLGHLRL